MHSPVIRLIEWVWGTFPQQAFAILRNRIYTNYPLSNLEKATIKVTAKRFSQIHDLEFTKMLGGRPELPATERDNLRLSQSLLQPHWTKSGDLHYWANEMRAYPFQGEARPILALLLNESGQLQGAAVNSSNENRLHHAEINLCRAFFLRPGGALHASNQKVPRNWTWLISLEPCKMCAEWIRSFSEASADAQVVFLDHDPGPWARHQTLRQIKKYSAPSPSSIY
jgi:hypothetical protein